HFARRHRPPALDPPVQDEDERRHDVFGREVRRNRGASIGPLECLSDFAPDVPGEHSAKMLMDDVSSASAHLRPGGMTTLPDVVEHRKTEPQDVSETTGARGQ